MSIINMHFNQSDVPKVKLRVESLTNTLKEFDSISNEIETAERALDQLNQPITIDIVGVKVPVVESYSSIFQNIWSITNREDDAVIAVFPNSPGPRCELESDDYPVGYSLGDDWGLHDTIRLSNTTMQFIDCYRSLQWDDGSVTVYLASDIDSTLMPIQHKLAEIRVETNEQIHIIKHELHQLESMLNAFELDVANWISIDAQLSFDVGTLYQKWTTLKESMIDPILAEHSIRMFRSNVLANHQVLIDQLTRAFTNVFNHPAASYNGNPKYLITDKSETPDEPKVPEMPIRMPWYRRWFW